MFEDFDDEYGSEEASRAFDPLSSFEPDDQDEYENPYAIGSQPRETFSQIDPELARRVIAKVQPDGHSLTGFASNLYNDVKDFAGGIQTLVGAGLRELPYLPRDIAHAGLHP